MLRVLRLDGIRLVRHGHRLLVEIGAMVDVGGMRFNLRRVAAGRLVIDGVTHVVDDLGDRGVLAGLKGRWPD